MDESLISDALWCFKYIFESEKVDLIDDLCSSTRIAAFVKMLSSNNVHCQVPALNVCANMLLSENPDVITKAMFEQILSRLV